MNYKNSEKQPSKVGLIAGIVLSIIGIVITLGTFFFFGPFFGFPILIVGSILLFNYIFSNTKKGVRILLDILLTIVVCVITYFVAMNIWKPNYVESDEVLEYLNNKYGEETKFSLSSKECDTQSNVCYYYFTEQNLNGKIFTVETEVDSSGSKNFKDTYIFVKYDEKLKEEYSTYYSKILNEGFIISSIYISDDYNIPLVSYDEYRKLLTNKQISVYLQPTLKLDSNNKYFHLKTNDESVESSDRQIAKTEIDKFIDKNFDIDRLKQEVENIVKDNNLNNITKIYFNFDDCEEDDYKVSCSKLIEIYNK